MAVTAGERPLGCVGTCSSCYFTPSVILHPCCPDTVPSPTAHGDSLGGVSTSESSSHAELLLFTGVLG